jgi:hypothetical protein
VKERMFEDNMTLKVAKRDEEEQQDQKDSGKRIFRPVQALSCLTREDKKTKIIMIETHTRTL